MRFLVDAQLPPALARYLEDRGHAAEHVYDIGMGSASDRTIWDYASRENAVLVTKDDDFIMLRALEGDSPVIVWIRIGNTTRRALLARMDQHIETIEGLLRAGERLIEVV